ncbi:MAG TPA: hypothetical protein PLM56_06115 [Cyclobacteriaceae bacterium]|jgi:hypothetical protein|nr:hypothetical protein [Cytophagales bacterium]HNT49427.1 hypothetical protein [Cyclobacteriaceae bacterium]HRE67340.1 hypothetical protein [Cyclobacteriaceae bacterium]HRF33052.1 hypothetical protein [Cyclobacteriaceae bacterium]
MKISIKKDFTIEGAKEKINAAFPQYTTSIRQGRILVVKKSRSSAALIFGGKGGSVQIKEGFPTMGQQLVFTLLLILLGILIPLIVYYIAYYPKQSAIRNEITEFLKNEYDSN